MTSAIIPTRSPDEIEFAACLAAIEARKRQATDLQTEIETLREAFSRFEIEYRARVRPVLVEIQQVKLATADYLRRIARLRAEDRLDPEDLDPGVSAESSQRREEGPAEEGRSRQDHDTIIRQRRRPRLGEQDEAELRRLYRGLAKRHHPDLARSPEERTRREAVMLTVNRAFHERDVAALRAIARAVQRDDPAFDAQPLAARLTWARHEIVRLDQLLLDLHEQAELMRRSETYLLWHTPEASAAAITRLRTEADVRLARLRDRHDEAALTYRRIVRRFRTRERLTDQAAASRSRRT